MIFRSNFKFKCYVITLPLLITTMTAQATTTAPEPLKVVASFSIIADMAKQVGSDHVKITTLVGPDEDAHVYKPKPADVITINQADIVLVNGLTFEGFLPRLVKSSSTKAPIIELTHGIETLSNNDYGHSHEKEHDHQNHHHDDEHAHHHHHHGEYDPHAWQSVRNAKIYVENIASAFCSADSNNCDIYQANAKSYNQQLTKLDLDIKGIINKIPKEKRIVITSHDAFNYFAHDYDVQFLSIEGLSTESEASAADVAKLSNKIKSGDVRAIFLENMANPRLIQQLSRETGIAIGGTLYSDALSKENAPASTYINMMRHNIDIIFKALTPSP